MQDPAVKASFYRTPIFGPYLSPEQVVPDPPESGIFDIDPGIFSPDPEISESDPKFELTTDESDPESDYEPPRATNTLRRTQRLRRGARFMTFDRTGNPVVKRRNIQRYDLLCIRNTETIKCHGIDLNESTSSSEIYE